MSMIRQSFVHKVNIDYNGYDQSVLLG